MKLKLIIVLLLFLSVKTFSQTKTHEKYFENGKLMEKGEIINGKNEGLWTFYYENGQISEMGEYVNDLEEGEWKSYYENGNIESIGNFKNGEENGVFIVYHENGQIAQIGSAIKGNPDGEYKEYNENGNLLKSGSYKNGEKSGVWIKNEYFDDGQLKTYQELLGKEKHGKYKSYYENGKLKEDILFKNGKEEGEGKIYYANGQLQYWGFAKNGRLDGLRKEYYENGNIKRETEYKYIDDFFSKRNGKDIEYYENGNIQSIKVFNEAQKNGVFKEYGENGKLEKLVTYKDDVLHGKQEIYENKSNEYYLSSVSYFKNGISDGKWIQFSSDGSYLTTKYYENGELIKTIKNGKHYLIEDYNIVGYELWDNGKLLKTVKNDDKEKDYEVYFQNDADEKVRIVIRTLNNNKKWENHGWYYLKPGEKSYLQSTKNSVIYFFAESVNSNKYVWKGKNTRNFNGDKINFREHKLTKGSYGEITLKLN